MLRQMPNRETDPRNPQNQPDRRRQDRRRERQPEGWPSDERRKDQRRENIQMAQTSGQGPMAQHRDGMTPGSQAEMEHSSKQMARDWPGENSQSGTSRAQKAEGHTPSQQTRPGERHEQKGSHEKGAHQKDAHEKGAPERGEGTARYSNPPSGKEFGPGGRERSFGPQNPQKKNDERESGNFGVSYDRGLGHNPGDEGAGGKTDSSQRDMGQTGQRK